MADNSDSDENLNAEPGNLEDTQSSEDEFEAVPEGENAADMGEGFGEVVLDMLVNALNDDSELHMGEDDMDSESESSREDYDYRLTAEHSYLLENQSEVQSSSISHVLVEPEPGDIIEIPVFLLNDVLLPGQKFPFLLQPERSDFLTAAMKKDWPYLGAIAAINDEESFYPTKLRTQVGVLIQVYNLTEGSMPAHMGMGFETYQTLTSVGLGRSRFELIDPIDPNSIDFAFAYSLPCVKKARARVLPEVQYPRFHADPFSSLCRFGRKTQEKYLSQTKSYDQSTQHYISTESHVKNLCNWLRIHFDQKRIDEMLDRGLCDFSYWVASNLPVDVEKVTQLIEAKSIDERLCLAWKMASTLADLVCASCKQHKLSANEFINLSSEGHSSHYINGHGCTFDLFTAKSLSDFRRIGMPSKEYSWFPGYAWTRIVCSSPNCGAFLGWRFSSSKLRPAHFYGLLSSALRPNYAQDLLE